MGMPSKTLLGTVFFLLLTMPVGGEEPRPGPPVEPTDDSPTPFACNTDTLLSGEKCMLEFAAPASTDRVHAAERNLRLASALAPKMCGAVSRLRDEELADPELRRLCEASFKAAASANCSLDGAKALFDEQGRFAEGSTVCYESLSRVLSKTRSMSALTARCCRCAAKACKLTQSQCNDRMVRGAASDATATCARTQCAEECEPTPGLSKTPILTPPPVVRPPDLPPPYWEQRAPVWPWY